MQSVLLSIFVCFILYSCTGKSQDTNEKEPDLIEQVRGAINPIFKDWVLFENGTYIIFDRADTIPDLKNEAIKLMKEYGPVYAGGPAGDFSVTHLTKAEGWVVSGHCYGMYTYVHPEELSNKLPNDMEIGLYGRSKRDKDGKKALVVYINRKK